MSKTTRRIIVLAGFAAALGGLYWLLHDVVSFSELVRQEERLRTWIRDNPLIAFAAGFGAYTLISLVPGTTGKSMVFGWFYGFWQGVVLVDFALGLAAVMSFLLSRYVLLEVVQSRLRRLYVTINTALERDGPFYLLTLRLVHTPFSLVNYASGATGVGVRTFWWTTQLGLLPGTIVCVLVGSRLPSLAEIEEQGYWSLVDPVLVIGLALTAALPFAVRWGVLLWRS